MTLLFVYFVLFVVSGFVCLNGPGDPFYLGMTEDCVG